MKLEITKTVGKLFTVVALAMVLVGAAFALPDVPTAIRSRADFDGDGKTDPSVFRPSTGNWYLLRSTAGYGAIVWGTAGDNIVPGDFDGDGKADTAVFRENPDPSMNFWYVLKSSTGTVQIQEWGQQFDVPTLGDYDGDNKTDIAVFRPSTSEWWILRSSDSVPTVQVWGASGDVPLVGDFDGDDKADLTVFRPSNATWYVRRSSNGTLLAQQYGVSGDKLVPGDYNGDGTTDFAVFRPSNNTWYTSLDLGTNYGAIVWGTAGDILVPGDYDGDGSDDIAIYRNGTWRIRRSTDGGFTIINFGLGSDTPIPNKYLPGAIVGPLDYAFTTQTGQTIPAGGTLVPGSTVDDGVVAITLPAGWASTVYGIPVTSLSAGTNGMLTVNGAAATTFTNTALPGAVGGTNPTLFPSWNNYDMDPADTVGGGIYTNTLITTLKNSIKNANQGLKIGKLKSCLQTQYSL